MTEPKRLDKTKEIHNIPLRITWQKEFSKKVKKMYWVKKDLSLIEKILKYIKIYCNL